MPPSNGFPFETPDYDIINLRAGFDMERLSFTVYWQNATDEEYYTGTAENFGFTGIRLKPNPMVYGGSVSYRFGG
jgi:iron complex outermembrane receptor protein